MRRAQTVPRGIASGAATGAPVFYVYALIGFALGRNGPASIWYDAGATLAYGVMAGALIGAALGAMRHRTALRAACVGLAFAAPLVALEIYLWAPVLANPGRWGEALYAVLCPALLLVPLALLGHRALEWLLRVEPVEEPSPPAPLRRPGSEPARYRI